MQNSLMHIHPCPEKFSSHSSVELILDTPNMIPLPPWQYRKANLWCDMRNLLAEGSSGSQSRGGRAALWYKTWSTKNYINGWFIYWCHIWHVYQTEYCKVIVYETARIIPQMTTIFGGETGPQMISPNAFLPSSDNLYSMCKPVTQFWIFACIVISVLERDRYATIPAITCQCQ